MQKNWYVIYTKPKQEKKVASTLAKRRIEIFLPLNSMKIISSKKIKMRKEPLFKSYIFANIDKSEIDKVRKMKGIINFLYWKGDPAIIQEDEIQLIKKFLINHNDIKVEKALVKVNEVASYIGQPNYVLFGNLLSVKNRIAKVNLPSIGFSLIAQFDPQTTFHPEMSFVSKDLLLQ
ncbi:MAG: UpxY family transcription antiterminator [Ginsengibacter sp.]